MDVSINKVAIVGDTSSGDAGYYEEGMSVDPTMGMGGEEVKDPLLSSWLFITVISVVVLIASVGLGTLLARRKIKKGIDLYED